MRVKFENYVQDYGRKLEAAKVKPEPGNVSNTAAVQAPGVGPVSAEPSDNASKPAP